VNKTAAKSIGRLIDEAYLLLLHHLHRILDFWPMPGLPRWLTASGFKLGV